MQQRFVECAASALLALALAWGLLVGSAQPAPAYAADPTPTPAHSNGEPGGHGGGG